MATTDTDNQVLDDFRVTMIEELGFSHEEAVKLAEAYYTQSIKGPKGGEPRQYDLRVDHHYIRRLMDKGATREQILKILL